jgi:translin
VTAAAGGPGEALTAGLGDVGRRAHAELAARHAAREVALRASRESIRRSANAIRAAHRADLAAADDLLADSAAHLDRARTACADLPMIRWAGFVADAEKEYAEACCTLAVVAGRPLPTPEGTGVDVTAWLNGAAETVGELRRVLLDHLRRVDREDRIERCEALLAAMDDIYAVLVTIDFPDGITAGLRRSTDVARSILERTRGDFTTAQLQERLREALDAHRAGVPPT